jgi:hypothetical protein
MRRKCLFYILITVVLGAVLFWRLALSFMVTEPRKITFSREDTNRISIGMTRSEVEAILGVPPGDYTTGPCDEPPNLGGWPFGRTSWASDMGAISIRFDPGGRVQEVAFSPMKRYYMPFWYRMLRSLLAAASPKTTNVNSIAIIGG